MARLKSAMVEWTCPKCTKTVTMHVAGSQAVAHRCPSTLGWVNFKRSWRARYDKL